MHERYKAVNNYFCRVYCLYETMFICTFYVIHSMRYSYKQIYKQMHTFLLVGDEIDAQFFYIIHLFQSSTCFEQTRAHHQEVSCINL